MLLNQLNTRLTAVLLPFGPQRIAFLEMASPSELCRLAALLARLSPSKADGPQRGNWQAHKPSVFVEEQRLPVQPIDDPALEQFDFRFCNPLRPAHQLHFQTDTDFTEYGHAE